MLEIGTALFSSAAVIANIFFITKMALTEKLGREITKALQQP